MSIPDFPPVPSPEDTERERFLAEQAEQEHFWLDRPDDYNVFEENCIFEDREWEDFGDC